MARRASTESGFTLLEVAAALVVTSVAVIPILVTVGEARTDTVDARITRQMQYLLEFKLNEITKGVADPENTTWLRDGGEEGNFADFFAEDPTFDTMDEFRREELAPFFYRVLVTEKILPGLGSTLSDEDIQARGYTQDPDGGWSRAFQGLEYQEAMSESGGEEEPEEPAGHRRFEITVTAIYDAATEDARRRLSVRTLIPIPGEPEMPGADAGSGGEGAGGGSANPLTGGRQGSGGGGSGGASEGGSSKR